MALVTVVGVLVSYFSNMISVSFSRFSVVFQEHSEIISGWLFDSTCSWSYLKLAARAALHAGSQRWRGWSIHEDEDRGWSNAAGSRK